MLHNCCPHESRMCPIDFGVKKSKVIGHNVFILGNIFAYNCFLFTYNIMKLHTNTTLELRMCPIYVRVKSSNVKVTIL